MSSHYMLCAVCVCYAVNALAASSSACYLFIHSFIHLLRHRGSTHYTTNLTVYTNWSTYLVIATPWSTLQMQWAVSWLWIHDLTVNGRTWHGLAADKALSHRRLRQHLIATRAHDMTNYRSTSLCWTTSVTCVNSTSAKLY